MQWKIKKYLTHKNVKLAMTILGLIVFVITGGAPSDDSGPGS